MTNKNHEPDKIRLQVISEMLDNETETNGLSQTLDILQVLLLIEWRGSREILNTLMNIHATPPELYEPILEDIDNEVKRRKALGQSE